MPAAVSTQPRARPRSRRDHHWAMRPIAGAQVAAFTNPTTAHGIASDAMSSPKLATTLNAAVARAPASTTRRYP